MPAFIDLRSQTFHRLTVLARAPNAGKHTLWRCLCSCGSEIVVRAQHLRNGNTKSCGCWNLEAIAQRNTKHGKSRSSTYMSWKSMHQRCLNPANREFHNYGGRGIRVCKRWMAFENFYADMGDRPTGRTLERKNPNGHYTPSNCVWATSQEQARSRRNNRWIEHNGKRQTLSDWARELGIYASTLHRRLVRMPVAEAFKKD